MKRTRSIHPQRRSDDEGKLFSSSRSTLLVFLFLSLLTTLSVFAPGCANQRLIDLHKGTSCSAENVQRYAAAHKLSYEQALNEIRKEDQRLWAEEESSRQQAAGSKQ